MRTLLWHDYETFGSDPKLDRPCQFAAIRTDHNLNIIEAASSFYCKPAPDRLPNPVACLVTGISPLKAEELGVSEYEFAKRIRDLMLTPGTCVVGYNNIRFDDEVTRFLLFRNFYDAYEREWRNGNSRWDIIDMLRLVRVLDGGKRSINWPVSENGSTSFKLELLTEANGIGHANAHDAVSDVEATISLARLVKTSYPDVYSWCFDFRSKKAVSGFLEKHLNKPVFHVSSKIPASLGCCSVFIPVCQSPVNPNAYILFDLRQCPERLMTMSEDDIRRALYERGLKPEERPGLKQVHANKCPVVLPASVIKRISQEDRCSWQIDQKEFEKNLLAYRSRPELVGKIKAVFDDRPVESELTEDQFESSLYQGGFLSNRDRSLSGSVHDLAEGELSTAQLNFEDRRLPELFFRFKARSFPSTLNSEELQRWKDICLGSMEKLPVSLDGQLGSYSDYLDFVKKLLSQESGMRALVLSELLSYSKSVHHSLSSL